MVSEDDSNKILEYLKKQGQTNTFKLASELDIDRHRILNIIKKLEEKQAVEVKSGIVNFLKFPRKERKVVKKKLIKVKKAHPKPKKKVKHKKTALEITQAENKRLREELLELEASIRKKSYTKNKKLREEAKIIEELQKKVKTTPKIIRRTRTIIKRVPVKSRKLKEQAEHIKELEEKIKELEEKASKPKIIRRTIVKKVPKIIRKTIVRKVLVKVKEEIPKKEEIKPKKFKLPKINLSGLGKNIKKLHVPEMFKK